MRRLDAEIFDTTAKKWNRVDSPKQGATCPCAHQNAGHLGAGRKVTGRRREKG